MKRMSLVLAAFAASSLTARAVQHVEHQSTSESPVEKVVSLLNELSSRIVADGQSEQSAYDKYACWCESTLGRKAGDITKAKEDISRLENLIIRLKGEIATHSAERKNLEKLTAANEASQREANDVREREAEEYRAEKFELEQNIGALDAAIKVLSGAGAGKKGFLETLQEAQVLGVVAGVRSVLRHSSANKFTSSADLAVVEQFVEKPEEFIGGRSAVSAVQVAQNPFGDYAPQSTQIQGILKAMHDAFKADLEKSIAEEDQQLKAFEALMQTKSAEHATLVATLEQHTLEEAQKTKDVTENRQVFDDTQAQLNADEVFFGDTKTACKSKASDWATRTRLRTQELHAISQAVNILSSQTASETFTNASSTALLQVGSITTRDSARKTVLPKIREIFSKLHSVSFAKVESQLRAGGHFDAVIQSIDGMIQLLRREEQEDIEHRDRCEKQQKKNEYDLSDLDHAMSVADGAISRMDKAKGDLETQISDLDTDLNRTITSLEDLVALRGEDYNAFIQSVRDDTEAVQLLEQAIVALSQFYAQKKGGALFQRAEAGNSSDVPPPTWTGDYNGRSSEGTGIVSILTMIRDDFKMEIKTARQEDAAAQKEFEEQRKALRETKRTQTAKRTALESEAAELAKAKLDKERKKTQLADDKTSEEAMKSSLETDCAWVATHFDSRRQKRKTEIAGLTDAKNYLAGVEAGTELA